LLPLYVRVNFLLTLISCFYFNPQCRKNAIEFTEKWNSVKLLKIEPVVCAYCKSRVRRDKPLEINALEPRAKNLFPVLPALAEQLDFELIPSFNPIDKDLVFRLGTTKWLSRTELMTQKLNDKKLEG